MMEMVFFYIKRCEVWKKNVTRGIYYWEYFHADILFRVELLKICLFFFDYVERKQYNRNNCKE